MALLRGLHAEGRTIVIITHDMALAALALWQLGLLGPLAFVQRV